MCQCGKDGRKQELGSLSIGSTLQLVTLTFSEASCDSGPAASQSLGNSLLFLTVLNVPPVVHVPLAHVNIKDIPEGKCISKWQRATWELCGEETALLGEVMDNKPLLRCQVQSSHSQYGGGSCYRCYFYYWGVVYKLIRCIWVSCCQIPAFRSTVATVSQAHQSLMHCFMPSLSKGLLSSFIPCILVSSVHGTLVTPTSPCGNWHFFLLPLWMSSMGGN